MVQFVDYYPVNEAAIAARIEIDRTGAAVLAFKSAHGRFPASLSECLNPVPTDPFDLRPLRDKTENSGFVVYSVGETGKLDGGRPDVNAGSRSFVFRYPGPSQIR
jgi:hypothetical protein